jgi:hypothetical protein
VVLLRYQDLELVPQETDSRQEPGIHQASLRWAVLQAELQRGLPAQPALRAQELFLVTAILLVRERVLAQLPVRVLVQLELDPKGSARPVRPTLQD